MSISHEVVVISRIIYGLLKHKDMEIACKCDLAATLLTVSSIDTVSNKLNKANLAKILGEVIF